MWVTLSSADSTQNMIQRTHLHLAIRFLVLQETKEELMSEVSAERTDAKRDPSVVRGRLYRITIYLLIVIALALLVWKIIAESSMQSEHKSAMKELRAQTTEQLETRTLDLLRATGTAAGFAVREALMEEDVTRLRSYADELVRNTSVETVIVTMEDGTVIASSDRNREGSMVDQTFRSLVKSLDTPIYERVEDARFRAVVPLTGLNQRIGLLIIMFQFAPDEAVVTE